MQNEVVREFERYTFGDVHTVVCNAPRVCSTVIHKQKIAFAEMIESFFLISVYCRTTSLAFQDFVILFLSRTSYQKATMRDDSKT